jgi:hypothetical protein
MAVAVAFPFVDCARAGNAVTRQFEKDIMKIIENGGEGQCKKTTLTVAASPRKFMSRGWW